MHDRGLCTDGASYDIVRVRKVNNDDFFLRWTILSRTDEPVALHSQGVEADSRGLDPDS
jgi:hypothetical protein